MKEDLDDMCENGNYIFDTMEFVVDVNNKIKWDSDPKTLIELEILLYCGKEE